jgi:hypothetical protein
VRHLQQSGADWVVGNIANVFPGDTVPAFHCSPVVTAAALIANPDIVRQQGTFFRRTAVEAAGAWNADLYMVMDFDLWLRMARKSPPKMVNENWSCFRSHAAQKSTHRNLLRQSSEITRILRRERAPMRLVAAHAARKRWYWLKGVLKSQLIGLGVVSQRYQGRPLRS